MIRKNMGIRSFDEKVEVEMSELEYHIREYLDVMKDEPDEWIKVSQIYHDLKRMLGDED